MKIETLVGEMDITSTAIGQLNCTGMYEEYSYNVICKNKNREYYIYKHDGSKSNKKKVEQIKRQIDFALNLNLTPEILLELRLEGLEYHLNCLNEVVDKLHDIIYKFERAFNED